MPSLSEIPGRSLPWRQGRPCLVALVLGLVVLQVGGDEPGSVRDRYSGKTVRDLRMGMELIDLRSRNAPTLGQVAPAFTLPDSRTGEPTTLASLHRDQPLVLFFGSYQCDVIHRAWPSLVRVFEAHEDRCNFAMVYIREAHATDGTLPEFAIGPDPKTFEERLAMAERFRRDFEVSFPILVDGIEDPIATRWAGWPVRIFVIGRSGRVLYASVNGPWGFRPGGGFQHGDGAVGPGDELYSTEPLDEFLKRFFQDEEP